jgi:hypothetical protein
VKLLYRKHAEQLPLLLNILPATVTGEWCLQGFNYHKTILNTFSFEIC